MSPKILIVDDEEAMLEVLRIRLEQWGYEVNLAHTGVEAQDLVGNFQPDIVLSDVVMPELSGLDLLKIFKKDAPDRPVVLMTAHGTVEMAVGAMKKGANDFLTKPLNYSKLKSILEAVALDNKAGPMHQSDLLDSIRETESGLGAIVGKAKQMRRIYSLIRRIAKTDAAVLITGESGTGKELVALTIHDLSTRVKGPFVPVNSAAIPEHLLESEMFGHEKGAFTGATSARPGCFELAHERTLFLDEIAEMPIGLQPKLLRVLEDGRVRKLGGQKEFQFDVRIISATNQRPRKAIDGKHLREDLFYRLNVFRIDLPPLRERAEDIPLLAEHFVMALNQKHSAGIEGIRGTALESLTGYAWPGNVRELRNIIERAVILTGEGWIDSFHIPSHEDKPAAVSGQGINLPAGISAAEAEKELILQTLEMVGGNKAEAARRLGLDVKTIRNKLKSYKVS
jgi:DNA-binding NtrC family response regulator